MPTRQWELMRAEVDAKSPEEACGFLAGTGQCVLAVVPVTNKLHSPVRYQMDPLEQLSAFQKIEQAGYELLGIYHSHPNGPDMPSATDIAEAYYPDVIYIIWYRSSHMWGCRGFTIREGIVNSVGIQVIQDK